MLVTDMFCKIVVKDAVNIENIVMPTRIHIIANKRAIRDLGDLSPYLKKKLKQMKKLIPETLSS